MLQPWQKIPRIQQKTDFSFQRQIFTELQKCCANILQKLQCWLWQFIDICCPDDKYRYRVYILSANNNISKSICFWHSWNYNFDLLINDWKVNMNYVNPWRAWNWGRRGKCSWYFLDFPLRRKGKRIGKYFYSCFSKSCVLMLKNSNSLILLKV